MLKLDGTDTRPGCKMTGAGRARKAVGPGSLVGNKVGKTIRSARPAAKKVSENVSTSRGHRKAQG